MIPILLQLALALPAYILLRRIYYAFVHPISSARDGSAPRPPLVADWIPFVGNALAMTKGDTFWRGVVARYGPAVRLRTMGEVRTFVTTPGLISYVYRNSKNFDFYYFRRSMQSKIFGMKWSHSQADAMDAEMFPQHHRAMQPGSIGPLIKRYADLLESGVDRFLRDIGPEGKVVDFTESVFDILYEASIKAFFSETFPHAQFKAPFMAFDNVFPLLNLAALPQLARRPAESARDEALNVIQDWWRSSEGTARAELAPAMTAMLEVGEKEGWPERDIASLFLAEIWALEANAPYAGIWAAVELLRNPSVLTRVQSEIFDVISTLDPPTLSTLLHKTQPELPGLLPLCNAVFQETLRFHVDTLSLRVVQQDCVIPANLLPNGVGVGKGLQLKAGEQVVCVTRFPTVDEGEWGSTAGTWDPDRFLKGAEAGRGSMNPFGGGVSMCEGRHFASAEILTFIAAFAHLFDAEIMSDSLHPNLQRPGLGVQQILGGMKVRLKSRAG